MERLTKAAVATGGAAVLLLGGAGTMAYWTATATATGSGMTSGTLTATGSTCTDWEFAAADGGDGTVDGTPAVGLIVPGDIVASSCTVTVTGTGDHLAVTAALAGDTAFAETNPLTADMTLATGDVTVDGAPAPAEGIDLSDGAAHTIQVVVTATFPYGDATDISANDTQDLTATLSDVTVTVEQVAHP